MQLSKKEEVEKLTAQVSTLVMHTVDLACYNGVTNRP